MDAGVIQLYGSLRYEVFLDLLQFGPLTAILHHNCLLVELVGQVSILVKVQGAPSGKHEGRPISETSESCQRLFVDSLFGWITITTA